VRQLKRPVANANLWREELNAQSLLGTLFMALAGTLTAGTPTGPGRPSRLAMTATTTASTKTGRSTKTADDRHDRHDHGKHKAGTSMGTATTTRIGTTITIAFGQDARIRMGGTGT